MIDYNQFTTAINPEQLSEWMLGKIRYSEFTKLKSPEQVIKDMNGSCHDQVMFELYELKLIGLNPKAMFMIEYSPEKDKYGTTHSFVYYEKDDKIYWFENAWETNEGIHVYSHFQAMIRHMRYKHFNGNFGNKYQYPILKFFNFGSHNPGESLETLTELVFLKEIAYRT